MKSINSLSNSTLFGLPLKLTPSIVFAFLFSLNAWAETAPASKPDPMKELLINLPPILALFALFYFVILRPQRTQQKKQSEFLSKLNKGDEVLTASGIIGTISGLNDRVVTLEVSEGTEIKVLRTQIQCHLKDALPVGGPKTA